MSISQSELVTIQHNFAKANPNCGARIVKVKIGDDWIDKCFLQYCPRCKRRLPERLKPWGIESCRVPSCGYQRRVYTRDEWLTWLKR
ncbi:hypothetical protein QUA42_27035 [Microcoleus sp. Pol11C2]|uniref:hypothetical protein n=1 Tax=Microcoleus sp. Pol11C2 TaxID=3055389 RepID=UPI002FD0C101